MKVDMVEIQKRIDEGLITMRKHRDCDLFVLNYTPRVQYDRKWDQYTTICRGLIIDREGTVVANTFPKFFNLNETDACKVENLPTEIPLMSEKLDGSLGTQYVAKGLPCIATRGSFESPQAIWATAWLQERYKVADFNSLYTYLFEIIYPENRNVVQYGERAELVLLAVRETETGKELDVEVIAKALGISHAKLYDFKSVHAAEEYLDGRPGTEQEGFVAFYPSTGLRVKMKSDDYFRLHKLLHQTSTTSIWEELSATGEFDMLADEMPKELYSWVCEIAKDLKKQYAEIMAQSEECMKEIAPLKTRKEQANYIKTCYTAYSGVCFALLSEKKEMAERHAWNLVKPKWKPFKQETAEEM